MVIRAETPRGTTCAAKVEIEKAVRANATKPAKEKKRARG